MLFFELIDEAGGKTRFLFIYKNFHCFMFYIANKILNDFALAEDAVQEALLYIAINIRKVENYNDSRVKNYVYLVTKHKAIDIARKNKKEICVEECILFGREDSAEKTVIQNLEIKKILNILYSLPNSDKEILELNIIYGYKPKEIAVLLGWTRTQSRKRLQRARKKLIDGMEEKNNHIQGKK